MAHPGVAVGLTDRTDVPLVPGASGWDRDELVFEWQAQARRNRGNRKPVSLTPKRIRMAAVLRRKERTSR